MGKNPWKSHGLLLMEISWNFSVRAHLNPITLWNCIQIGSGLPELFRKTDFGRPQYAEAGLKLASAYKENSEKVYWQTWRPSAVREFHELAADIDTKLRYHSSRLSRCSVDLPQNQTDDKTAPVRYQLYITTAPFVRSLKINIINVRIKTRQSLELT